MYSFEYTWPYEKVFDDVYVEHCPFCKKESVLLPLKLKDLKRIQSGIKKMIVMPCCHQNITITEIDEDYLYLNRKVR
ncbi:hypothetical protein [Tepidibacillus marianensis]|uniref:hypothetical protein n=1 Tax=Tepidibacillus marianensis TaxID=3131995 RepID=UPI0030D462D2